MKKAMLFIILASLMTFSTACSQSNVPAENKAEVKQEALDSKGGTPADNNKEARIFFDMNNSDDSTYKQHVESLWEKTKPLLREDINKDYSDEELKKLGAEIDTAWVNLQIHSSMNHMEEIDSIEDPKYGNIMEDIIQLVDELYANRYMPTEEKRQERLENLKNGRLEFKIKEFDETLKNAK
ncbi:MAG: hypothetical protein ACOX6I_05345 [Syntrophomonadaceae bacterium]|jgi:hypothetical protein